MTLPKSFDLSQEVLSARRRGLPIVALESTVITHGLPRPQNLQLARELESILRAQGATPATIAVHNGRICVGLESEELDRLAGVEAKESSLSAVARRPKADEAILVHGR
ncbi:MAG: pseudouridine-5'-phosphate glycosidase [Candidatus Aminicenantales bacterium]